MYLILMKKGYIVEIIFQVYMTKVNNISSLAFKLTKVICIYSGHSVNEGNLYEKVKYIFYRFFPKCQTFRMWN